MAQTFKTSIVVDGNVNATGFYGDGSNLTGITPTGALLLTGGDMTGSLTITAGGIPLTLTSSQNTGLVVDGGTNSGVIADFKFGTRKAYISTSGNIYASGLFDIDDTNYYVNPASTSNLNALNVGGQAVITAGNIGSQSVSYAASSGNADTVDSLHASSFVRSDLSSVTIQRHLDASTTWTNDILSLFLGWHGGKVVIGNNGDGLHDAASAEGANSIVLTNTTYSFKQTYMYHNNSLKLYMGSDGTRNTGWAYHTNNDSGLHWPNNGWHLMPADNTHFRIYSGSSSEVSLRMETAGTTRGYIYADSSNNIGFLNTGAAWRFRVDNSGNTIATAGSYARGFYDDDASSYYLDPSSTGISLNTAGSVISNGAFGTNGYGSGNLVGRVYGPRGATYSSGAASVTGAIKIRLPIRSNDTMWSMKVRIYNYSSNATSEYLIGNYSYSAGAWNYAATYFGSASSAALTVRLGNEGGYDCVWIGETSTGWSHPVVSVMDFMGGYSNGSAENYDDNWDITFVTSFGTIGASISPDIKFSTGEATSSFKAPVFYDSNNTGYYLDPHATSNLNVVQAQSIRNDGDVSSDDGFGIYWTDTASTAYGIYREGGGWSSPYPDLRVAFHTGIKLGANSGYNGIRFYTDYDMATQVMSVNNGSDGVGAGHVHVNYIMNAGESVRAPIFYDNNNTGYYLNAAGDSRINTIYFNTLRDPNSNWILGYQGTNYFSFGSSAVADTVDFDVTYINQKSVTTLTDTSYYRGSPTYGFRFNSNADTINALIVNNSGDSIAYSSHRAPIFYDSNDTTYYGDFASTSLFNVVRIGSNATQTFAQLNISNGSSTATLYRDIDLKGGWAAGEGHAITATHGTSSAQIVGQMVFQHDSPGSRIKWGRLYHSGDQSTYPMHLISSGSSAYLEMNTGDMRAPIFYDYNNTGYYVNPGSQSNVDDFRAAAYRGNANVGGTGTATWHPDGIYCGGTMWQYGSQYKNGTGIYDVGEIKLNGGPYIQTYNSKSVIIRAQDGEECGITGRKSDAGFAFQIYGSGSGYGFLGYEWGDWDIRKVPDGRMYLNANNNYYLQTDSDNYVYRIMASQDARAPVFYDQNDTNYYLDPTAGANSKSLLVDGFVGWPNHQWTWSRGAHQDPTNSIKIWDQYSNYGGSGNPTAYGTILHITGRSSHEDDQLYFSYDGQLLHRNAFYGSDSWSSWHSVATARHSFTNNVDLRAPIFYDSNNTGYYVDPSSLSNLNVVAGSRFYAGYDSGVGGSFSCSDWFRSNGSTGWYNATYAGGIYMTDSTWVRTYNDRAFYTASTLAAGGDVIAYYSDERLKDKKGCIENPIEKVKSLNAFYYTNNEIARQNGFKKEDLQIGLSAQEVQKIAPEIVTLAPFDMETLEDGEIVSKSGENYLTLNYAKLVPILVEAIKEQQSQIEELKAIVNGLTK